MSTTIKAAIEALKGRIADAYEAVSGKGGTLPATQDSANLPTAIASIPSGGSEFNDDAYIFKDVTFIDHLGIVADYTFAEAAVLTELPTPKTYDRLTFVSWTKTLAQVKDGKRHVVAAIYQTTDGLNHYGIDTRLISKTVVLSNKKDSDLVDWGDGTQNYDNAHTYAEDGIYIIKMTSYVVVQTNLLRASYSFSMTPLIFVELNIEHTNQVFFNGDSGGNQASAPYLKYITFSTHSTRCFLPTGTMLKYLASPNSMTSIDNVKGAYNLRCMNVPNGVASFANNFIFPNLKKIVFYGITGGVTIGNNALYSNQQLELNDGVTSIGTMQYATTKEVYVPTSVTSIPANCFNYSSILKITIAGSPSIGATAFRDANMVVHILSSTPPTLLSSVVFYNYRAKNVYIPAGSLAAYEADTNWSASIASGFITLIEE